MVTYNQLLQEPISNKVVLFEIDKGVPIDPLDPLWSKSEPGIWRFQWSWFTDPSTRYNYGNGSYGYFPYGYGGELTYGWGFQLWGNSPWGEGGEVVPIDPPREVMFLMGSFFADGDSY
jgi:hypothetical protein